ncbi:polysaccharide biosynthesis protein [Clostridiales bacterium FE2011]|nr:polysaccharide biosynthesis protein [Clostridiales bacterium FE2011]
MTLKQQQPRWKLFLFDLGFYLLTGIFIFIIYPSTIEELTVSDQIIYIMLGAVCVFALRFVFGVYKRIWRYAGSSDYLWIVIADFAAGIIYVLLREFVSPRKLTFVRAVSLICLNLLGAICMRLTYQFAYQNRNQTSKAQRTILRFLQFITGVKFAQDEALPENRKIRIAIIGAGSVGAMLADELLNNPKAVYKPVCFVDANKEKVGRTISRIPVVNNETDLNSYNVQEVVFALPNISNERRKELFDIYKGKGYKIKVYDYPSLENTDGRRQMRDFAIEDLLYRSTVDVIDEKTASWYRGKNVLITGGGGSIGSELARQIAKIGPSRLTLLDNYENGVYDIQQELKTRYPELNLRVEIVNICDRDGVERVLSVNTPDIVLHAAAHKHVPLMERNVMEAVKNNVFGTLNVVEVCEKYGVKRFIMISTDKAVNPTNVMGATKRMCEMIVQSRKGDKTSFSATRFGNVLGSNGSVIPLFRRQIANGGPVTVTDKRITRFFMTIPEASQLVMTSGAMAKNGELYVLDMGKPVKIYDLAEEMIRLSGLEPHKDIEIVETGLRPGEKLYEELLIKTEEMDKTENDLIFIERDKPLSQEQIQKKLDILKEALATGHNTTVKEALMKVVPTYHTPEEVNESHCRMFGV